MSKGWIIGICSCFLIGFGCDKAEEPSVPMDKMVEILVDVHLIEASLLGYSEDQKDSLSQVYYHQVYEIHSISEDSFINEMDYLRSHPDYLTEVYEKVLEAIDKKEAELK